MPSRELQLIVNADDFGQSDDTVDATIECFEAGALTSATLMPGMPASERALDSPVRTRARLRRAPDPQRRPRTASARRPRARSVPRPCRRDVAVDPRDPDKGAHRAPRAGGARTRDRGAAAFRGRGRRARLARRLAPAPAQVRAGPCRAGDRAAAAGDPARARRPGPVREPSADEPDVLARPSAGARRSGEPSRRPSTSSCLPSRSARGARQPQGWSPGWRWARSRSACIPAPRRSGASEIGPPWSSSFEPSAGASSSSTGGRST